jgi:hypothetical protein
MIGMRKVLFVAALFGGLACGDDGDDTDESEARGGAGNGAAGASGSSTGNAGQTGGGTGNVTEAERLQVCQQAYACCDEVKQKHPEDYGPGAPGACNVTVETAAHQFCKFVLSSIRSEYADLMECD